MLGNVLGLLGMLRNVLGMLLQRPRHACNVLGLLGMLPARSSLVVHYSLDFTAYKEASGEVLSSMWDS